MGWARFDDGYTDHPKTREAGPWAELLDMRAIIYCARYSTDGLVSVPALKVIGRQIPKPHEKADRLVRAERWSTSPSGGWFIHDFLEYNLSKAQMETHREANRDRQAKWRRNAVTNTFVTMGTGRVTREDVKIDTATCERCGGLTPCHCNVDELRVRREAFEASP